MYCQNCRKLAMHTDGEPEVTEHEVDVNSAEHFEAYGEVTLKQLCADCEEPLSEATTDFSIEFEHEHTALEIEAWSAEATERFESLLNAKGHPVPNRGRKYRGADLTFTIRCNTCGQQIEVSGSTTEVRAGSFEAV